MLGLQEAHGIVNLPWLVGFSRNVIIFPLTNLVILGQVNVWRSANGMVSLMPRYPVEPGNEGVRVSERCDLPENSHPSLLQNVIGRVRRSHQLADEVSEPRMVGAHQSFECTLVAKLATKDLCTASQSLKIMFQHAIGLVPAHPGKFTYIYPFSG